MSDFIDGYDCAIRRQQETVKKIIEEEKNERENNVDSSARA